MNPEFPTCDCNYYNETEFYLGPSEIPETCDTSGFFDSPCDTTILVAITISCTPPGFDEHGHPVDGSYFVAVQVNRDSPFIVISGFRVDGAWDGVTPINCLLKDMPLNGTPGGNCDWSGATASIS